MMNKMAILGPALAMAAVLSISVSAQAGKRTYGGNLCQGQLSVNRNDVTLTTLGYRVTSSSDSGGFAANNYSCPLPLTGLTGDPVSIDIRYYQSDHPSGRLAAFRWTGLSGLYYTSATISSNNSSSSSQSMILTTDTGTIPSGTLNIGSWILYGSIPYPYAGATSGIFSYMLLTN